ncbi:MAG: MoaD/ThiS family protein [Chloracidobacterium sp.]|nr:MoaD/ThiS family protein [Chloracidobacterium sp.]MDW8218125.1 MoaD/ThiS family protein [Acidobacteriota bacterium]
MKTVDDALLKVLVFGQCRALVGADAAPVQVAVPTTAGAVLDAVCEQYPQLAPLRGSLLVAVNEAYARAETPVENGDEVAVFPPIAGG